MSLMPDGWVEAYSAGAWYYTFGTVRYKDDTTEPWRVLVGRGSGSVVGQDFEQDVVDRDMSPESYKDLLAGVLTQQDGKVARNYYLACEAIRHYVREIIHESPDLERQVLQKAFAEGWIGTADVVMVLFEDVMPAYAAMLTQLQREQVLWYMMAFSCWDLDSEEYEESTDLITWMSLTHPHAAENIQQFASLIHDACKDFMEKPEAAKAYVHEFVIQKPAESYELPALD